MDGKYTETSLLCFITVNMNIDFINAKCIYIYINIYIY